MSADYYLGLVGELPDLRALDSRVADFGGVEGDWTKGIEIGGVTVHRLALDEREDALEFLEQSLRENDKPSLPITSILILSRGPFEAVDSVGGVLVALCGGVLANEDGDVMQYEPGPRPLEPPSPSPLLDVSIPPLVEQQFANEQQLYAVAARKQPSVHFQALVKKLSMKPERVGHGAGGVWEANSIGQLVLKQHLPHELHHWSSELTAIGCPAPTSLFRLSFAYWHVKSVSDRDWRDMLAVVCGLARLTDGVVYRIAAPSEAHFDFAPREQISSATEGSRPKAPPRFLSYLVLAVLLGIVVGVILLLRPSEGPCTVKQSFGSDDICIVSGTLKAVGQANKDLNAKRIGRIELDEILIEDDTGTRSLYFDPARFSFDGRTTARVTGKEVEERGTGARRFVVSKVE